MAERKRLIVIDDDTAIGDFVSNAAAALGIASAATSDPNEFKALIERDAPDFAVLDLQMPEMDGIELLRWLALLKTAPKVLLMSGTDQRVLAAAARLALEHKLPMIGALRKPFPLAEFHDAIRPHLGPGPEPAPEEIRRALAEGEIEPWYQPLVALGAGRQSARVEVVEALARWRHPARGIVSPAVFVPSIERLGLAGQLTELMLRRVLDRLRAWDAAGRRISASINLAQESLKDLDLPDRLFRMVRDGGIETRRITFEVTETTAMENTTLSLDVLGRIRLKGFGLSIDDFGTGYSSLIELYRMPFSSLKIDKSFVLDSDTSEEARVIVRSIADLAHNLGLSVCAEGVERPEHLAQVIAAGCEMAQGYLFSKPVPPESLPEEVALAREDAHAASLGRTAGWT